MSESNRSISGEPNTSGIAHLLLNVVDLVCEPSQVHLTQLLVFEFLHECVGVLPIHIHLQPLDVPFVVLHALSKHLNVVLEHGRLSLPLLIHFLPFFPIAFELGFEGC